MSNLDRILELARHGTENAQSQVPVERELKEVPAEAPVAKEAAGEFAQPLYTLQDDLGLEDNILVDELAHWLDAQDITDFVENFRRHHDMNHPGEDGDYGEDDENFGEEEAVEGTTVSSSAPKVHKAAPVSAEDKANADAQNAASDSKLIKKAVNRTRNYNDDGIAPPKGHHNTTSNRWAESTDKVTEAQSPAQKAAFAKMLAAKNGGKDDAVEEAKAKPDYADIDGDGDEKETMKKAAKDKEVKEETVTEAPTMDTTQLITLLKNSGLSEEAINKKINEWANTPDGAAEEEATSHGEPYENFAQSVNLSLKRYLDAEDFKVGLKEHKVEDIKEAYQEFKGVPIDKKKE